MKKVDILIVGGGILGYVLANQISRSRTVKSAVIISSNDFHRASTQNQSWLQSGLIYNLDHPLTRREAELCAMHGRKLLELRNKSINANFGVMALPNEHEAQKKITFLNQYGFPYDEPIIPQRKIPDLLGNYLANSGHFTSDTYFIRTPDQSFDEEGLLRFCEVSLRRALFDFRSVKGSAQLLINPSARNGYSIIVNEEEFDPGILFLAVGLNTKRFLSPLEIEDFIELKARRCVLMKAALNLGLKPSILVDRIASININAVKGRRSETIYLIGDILNQAVPDMKEKPFRQQVTEEDKIQLFENLCQPENFPQLKNIITPLLSDDQNFSVCYKVEDEGHLPWIYETNKFASRFPNMYIAGPGKATLAYYTANELLNRANITIQDTPIFSSLMELDSEIEMWFKKL
jgi:hypothetical protein